MVVVVEVMVVIVGLGGNGMQWKERKVEPKKMGPEKWEMKQRKKVSGSAGGGGDGVQQRNENGD